MRQIFKPPHFYISECLLTMGKTVYLTSLTQLISTIRKSLAKTGTVTKRNGSLPHYECNAMWRTESWTAMTYVRLCSLPCCTCKPRFVFCLPTVACIALGEILEARYCTNFPLQVTGAEPRIARLPAPQVISTFPALICFPRTSMNWFRANIGSNLKQYASGITCSPSESSPF